MILRKTLAILGSSIVSLSFASSFPQFTSSRFGSCCAIALRTLLLTHTKSMSTICKSILEFECTDHDDETVWKFMKSNYLRLPIAKVPNGYTGPVPKACFAISVPTPMVSDSKDLRLVIHSPDVLAQLLDMSPVIVDSDDFVDFVSGQRLLSTSVPLAHRYGGHQFGYWAQQLGDGRAISIGQYNNSKSEIWDLQLKGAGSTPFSRFADGRAVLRSSIREFLCSEHMLALGVPTSRALSLVVSKGQVVRDQFYNGRVTHERTAVVLRLMPNWFRIGSLEIHYANQELTQLQTLVQFIIQTYYGDIFKCSENWSERYLSFADDVVDKTALMIAHWMTVGFAHGVMNTDNFSLLGLTIDYGPFGFIDEYDSLFVPNSSDTEARYSFKKQPNVAKFNLLKFAEALLPVFVMEENEMEDAATRLATVINQFELKYEQYYKVIMARKFGIGEVDIKFIDQFLDLMETSHSDFTMSFRQLSDLTIDSLASPDFTIPSSLWALKKFEDNESTKRLWDTFRVEYAEKIKSFNVNDDERKMNMISVNPRYVLRNWMAESSIKKANNDDFSEIKLLFNVLTNPFEEQEVAELAGYANPPPSWSDSIRVSCSS